ncbi:hypothetical protein HanIR_Chr12g0562551 [Helianthus annuus]|nr:hypothetical protein HanIR_Chr12g0562551 [Helianthus annuus]
MWIFFLFWQRLPPTTRSNQPCPPPPPARARARAPGSIPTPKGQRHARRLSGVEQPALNPNRRPNPRPTPHSLTWL